MKTALTFLFGGATASAWWACALWAYKTETLNLTGLWIIPAVLTFIAFIFAGTIAEEE